jgi:release factor glutamine methyltransferase
MDLLLTTDEFLKSKGIESSRRNAEALFSKALGIARLDLYLQHDRPVRDDEIEALRELIKRRAKREPLQYILGEVEFCDCRIRVASGLLVPRPETECLTRYLTSTVTSDVIPPFAPPHFAEGNQKATGLDLGCGTGCIAIAIAKALPTLSMTAVDLNPLAVRTTRENAELNGVSERIQVLEADFSQTKFAETIGKFDLVVSNPPYVREDELSTLEPEVRDHEDKRALVAGPRGDEAFVILAAILPQILKPDGTLAVEFGMGQVDRVKELFAPDLSQIEIHRDLAGHERFLIGRA